MTTEQTAQTAQQLELAAQILRTGHPWEYRVKKVDGEEWHDGKISDVSYYAHYSKIRPVLATPPDNRPLHNPDNLTAEQVGVGYRLTVEGESVPGVRAEWWCRSSSAWLISPGAYLSQRNTVRVPLKTPWPEPAFQLPPPPPGMRWHREDGWTADDLPSGYRPLVDGENWVAGDEILRFAPHGWQIGGMPGDILDEPTHSGTSRCRTTRPLVFNHAGKTWTWHRPGDPMPCDGERIVAWLMRDEDRGYLTGPAAEAGCKDIPPTSLNWEADTTIIGWRYAEPQTKTVPLGPEDVPPGSALSLKPPRWFVISGACDDGVYILDDEPLVESLWKWHYLAEKAQINRSIPLTGKWNPDAWEPCSKTIPTDENLAEPKSR